MTPEQVRSTLVDALRLDLVGPSPDDVLHAAETLPTSPSTWYLTGFLVPFEAAEPDDTATEQVDQLRARPGADDDPAPDRSSARKAPFPSSIGLSVLLPADARALDLEFSWGDYAPLPKEDPETPGPVRWVRTPRSARLSVRLDERAPVAIPGSGGLRVQVACRPARTGNGGAPVQAASVFLVNHRPAAPDVGRDAAFAFQATLRLVSDHPFVARPDLRGHGGSDRDERVAELQFRDCFEYAVGHGVATVAEADPDGACRAVRTEWVPQADVERVEPSKVDGVELGMEALAGLPDGQAARRALGMLPQRYADWIERQRATPLDTEPRRALSAELMDAADFARSRIEAGIALLDDDRVRGAFTLANRVMAAAARQRDAIRTGMAPAAVDPPTWRPFQLAFLLLNLRGIVQPGHAERRTVDLLFFPTGGGKTEAYLGLAAFSLVWRRLGNPGIASAGVTVLMRYTLRLLTFDQLGRAAALVCALELERQRDPATLGTWPFEIGLWVGMAATPNRMGTRDNPDPNTARVKVDRFARGKGPSPIPLETCPWCGTQFKPLSFQLVPDANYPSDLRLVCVNRGCPFGGRNPLPILTVDEPIYRRLPGFLVATVDKFAQLPWVAESGKLLGRAERYDSAGFYGAAEPGAGIPLPGGALLPPDLVIQDELHLISGPLGTMVGLVETAIDALSARVVDGHPVRPKVVASTATVRRAERQIQALFGRGSVEVFPPPGPDRRDSFFAETVRTSAVPGRRYVGVAAQGRSLKVVFLRTLLAILSAAQTAWEDAGGKRAKPNPADPYMSLVAYFNSLRELGGSRRIVEDEVASRLAGYGSRRREGEPTGPFRDRRIAQPVELTSRESTSKVADTKRRLELSFHDDDRVDVALATNMISVGLDITRLGLMVVVGQPKMSSEYIQATSRVGRDPTRPGLVVTLMNLHRPRDRSHYESFAAYHQSFYRSVEATSVTPFSPRAIDRGIAGVTVTLARHGLRSLTAPVDAVRMRTERGRVDFVADEVAERAANHQSDLDPAVRDELRQRSRGRVADLLDDWVKIADRKHNVGAGLMYQKGERGDAPPLLRDPLNPELATVSPEERRFKANRSMRDVEPSVNLWAKTLDGQDVASEEGE
ncbi:DISARM system helicase DrmA [Myxococcota bacterium]|nr:DISARM system helicase DrmA [Myxococcota bacterium]